MRVEHFQYLSPLNELYAAVTSALKPQNNNPNIKNFNMCIFSKFLILSPPK